MCRPFTAASSVGGSGRLTESQAAWGTQELRTERRRRIAMDPLHSSAAGLVAMPGISAQSPCTHSMTWPGGLGYSCGSEICSAGWDTECCSMGRLTRLNQLKLAYFSPDIDELVG